MRNIVLALAATTLLASPALADRGRSADAPGHQPKVCLLTFNSTTSRADADVVKAQYLPLSIAQRLEARNDAYADIFTYGANDYGGTGVDYPNTDPANLGSDTQSVCEAFMDMTQDADHEDADDD